VYGYTLNVYLTHLIKEKLIGKLIENSLHNVKNIRNASMVCQNTLYIACELLGFSETKQNNDKPTFTHHYIHEHVESGNRAGIFLRRILDQQDIQHIIICFRKGAQYELPHTSRTHIW
jgi:hypothetical protein